MAFEYRFNVIRFYSKLNRFVLSPRKKPNHFVLKIRPGGFADYTSSNRSVVIYWNIFFILLSIKSLIINNRNFESVCHSGSIHLHESGIQ